MLISSYYWKWHPSNQTLIAPMQYKQVLVAFPCRQDPGNKMKYFKEEQIVVVREALGDILSFLQLHNDNHTQGIEDYLNMAAA